MVMEKMMSLVSDDFKEGNDKLAKNGLYGGLVAYGSARIPMDDPHLIEVVEIAKLCAKRIKEKNKKISFMTGGGPSVMEGWLKGAYEEGAQASGISLVLPHETESQRLKYANQEISHVAKTFQSRKALLMEHTKATIIFKGGFGTMDELFEALTLMKTKQIPETPVFIYPAEYYKNVLNFDEFVKMKTIGEFEKNILHYYNTKEELLEKLYDLIDNDKD